MKKTTNMRNQDHKRFAKFFKRAVTFAIASLMFVMATMSNGIMASATESTSSTDYEIVGQYSDDFDFEWDYECAFSAELSGGTAKYNYSILYESTEEDVDTMQNLLLDPSKISGLHIRKYDKDGDGELKLNDFIELYKEVTLPAEGFEYDGAYYKYNIKRRSTINAADIETVAKILAHIIKPEGGSYVTYYDYNFNGKIDLHDLVLMNQFYSQNPCNFVLDFGAEIQPDEFLTLLESADSFGVENFIIKWTNWELEPYMILMAQEQCYSEMGKYPSKPMQLVPRSDTTLDCVPQYLLDDQGDDWSLWRWEQEGDNFDDLLWVTQSDEMIQGALSGWSGFALIPLDAEGNKLGTLFNIDMYD